MLTDIEDTIELHEAKEAAYHEGLVNGFLLGVPIGTLGTFLLGWFTMDKWLILIK